MTLATAPAPQLLLHLDRLGVVMTPDPADPREALGVLNPASARAQDGTVYLFPRLVAEGNYSRIAIARVRFDADDNPSGVERLGIVLEPREPYELAHRGGGGGVEDPRITYVPQLDHYVMTYTAFGQLGPRIAMAVSKDLFNWERLGLVHFAPTDGVDFNHYTNKDCVVFPTPVPDPAGSPAFALLHRPTYLVQQSDDTVQRVLPPGIDDPRPSIWISYVPVDRALGDIGALAQVTRHQLVTAPTLIWEQSRIGAGAPPVLTDQGWLLVYHGVFRVIPITSPDQSKHVVYHAGAMLLNRDDPRRVIYRTRWPILHPRDQAEREGIVPHVVFPTAIDARGQRIDVYYGAADSRIGVATAELPMKILLAPSAWAAGDRSKEIET